MIELRRLFLAGIIFSVTCFAATNQIGGVATAQTNTQTAITAAQVEVDLLRGFAGVFSLGMDTLADSLRRQGYRTRVGSHRNWRLVARHIADRYARAPKEIVVLIGHSLGADATLQIANELDKSNIPIELIVTFDATNPQPVPKNVLHFVNFYLGNGIGKRISPGPGFQGELTNLNLTEDASVRHTNIDQSERLHAYVAERIAEIVKNDLANKVQASKPKAQKSQNRR